ncbi:MULTISPECIES: type II TA system antitoxin MqsA family protein [unclassified Brevibacillus]|uniref:type II TA system antitoxin MqsA family protein n=1 Tax=unclassified Brevibacillus TaxID=2684853 RepID=UPI0035686795
MKTEIQTLFCHKCDQEREFKLIEKTFNYPVKEMDINITGMLAFCNECNEELFHPIIDEQNQETAFKKYRDLKGIVQPEEIIAIRKKYNLNQRDYSKLLGFGEITITRYENGSIPTQAQNQIIKASSEPHKMLEFFEQNKDKISDPVKDALSILLESLCKQTEQSRIIDEINNVFFHPADDYSGFQRFSMEKFNQMVLFFAEKERPYKTKLNKLMYYADNYFYKLTHRSISGSRYVCHNYGPVPEKYETLFENNPEVDWKEDDYGSYVVPTDHFNPRLFTAEELEMLNYVVSKFRHFTSTQIKDFSHWEKGWIETPHKEFIPYSFAKDLDPNRTK